MLRGRTSADVGLIRVAGVEPVFLVGLRHAIASGYVALVAMKKAKQETGMQTRCVLLIDSDIRRFQQLNKVVNRLKSLVFLLLADQVHARGCNFQNLAAQSVSLYTTVLVYLTLIKDVAAKVQIAK